MNLKTEKGTITLSDAVKSRITNTSYGSDDLQQASEVADQIARAFGDLIDRLTSKGILDHEEALDFTDYTPRGYNQATIEP